MRASRAVAGLHGGERRRASGRLVASRRAGPPPEEVARARARLGAVAAADDGVFLEDKGNGFALHFRAVPERGEACVAAVRGLESAAFEVLLGDSLAELRPRGVHKGAAVGEFMAEAPFAGRTPVFVGDDVTDEDGFRAVNEMDGVSVLSGSRRPTAARYHLPDVPSVVAWLRGVPRAVAP